MIESQALQALFYLFSSIALISGVMVITAKNPVHSVLFLILVFCNAAGLLILLNLDFFAMIFLIVYVGAIAVLFLFVVMMLNIKLAEINESILRYLPVGGFIGLLFVFEILLVIDNDLIPVLVFPESSNHVFSSGLLGVLEVFFYKLQGVLSQSPGEYRKDLESLLSNSQAYGLPSTSISTYTEWALKTQSKTNIEALGQIIYTYYSLYFILASLILLVAMIGAIVLTMHKGVHVKRQEVFEQNTRDHSQTVHKIGKLSNAFK
uniref:NADH-ubiquinone oxidoreductase chain 6 n=1 Tax=Monomastix sp. (strain OKE-1) TaxID=141716 RepID=U5YDX9_MONSK|nr:NADH dehydrogenase subunit 6 [Monomastix sp. OKE-1]AGZ90183.1 NADH dehydrogenase subunit 6 [Monomastix sp. OKE-1]